jgi:predicted RecB family endonuclease
MGGAFGTRGERSVKASVRQLLRGYFKNAVERAIGALVEVRKHIVTEDKLERLKGLLDGAPEEASHDNPS